MPADADPDAVLRIATNFTIGGAMSTDPIEGGMSAPYDGIAYLTLGTPLFLDRDGSIKPYLAEGYEIPDPRTFVLKLREGLTYQDGQPYDAQSLKDTYDAKLASTTNTAFAAGPFREIESITVDSPTQLTFKMKSDTAGQMPFVMTHQFSHAAAPGYDPLLPAGAGPYRITEWREGEFLRLEKWDGFFRADEFFINTIEYSNIPAREAAINALRAGQVDLISVGPAEVDALVATGDFDSVVTNNEAHYHLQLCVASPPFDDPEFREAFWLAINQEQINQAVMGGKAEEMTSLWPPGSVYALELADPAGDQERARQLIEENGWDGMTVKMGHYNVQVHQRILEVIQGQLADVGINVELVPFTPGVPINQFINLATGGGYIVAQVYPGIAKVAGTLGILAPKSSSWECGGQEYPEIADDVAALVAGSITEEEAKEAWTNIQTYIFENHLDMPVLSQPAVYAFDSKIVGLQSGTVGLTSATSPGPFLEGVYIKRG